MKSMYISKIAASLGLAAVLLASCGSKDKNAELNDLKAKRSEIDGQIASLEKELGITNAVKARKVMTTDVVAAPFKHCVEIQGTVDAENNKRKVYPADTAGSATNARALSLSHTHYTTQRVPRASCLCQLHRGPQVTHPAQMDVCTGVALLSAVVLWVQVHQ